MKAAHGNPRKVGIIGCGNVGATFAYALTLSGLASEIVLIDANEKKAQGEAADLNHAVPLLQPTRITAGGYADLAGAAVTVITAGSAQRPGETRLDLLQRNVTIFQSIIPRVVESNPDGILLIATNPVDILSYAAWKISGLPHERVIGSGTVLDTARFRHLLSQAYEVDPRSVHAYIIGEHGDSEVPVWSLANIAGMRLDEYCKANHRKVPALDREAIFHATRDAAYEIIEAKGATYYAIGAGLLRIVESILRDQGTVLSVSNYIEQYYDISDVYISLPCIIDRHGIAQSLCLSLDAGELMAFRDSANLMKTYLEQLAL
ncbi:MAG: L-lactate dehydrogenase [Anaerolineae bacterium]|nr:L-lactate dehydrogenase [Anaerolineae bacterium]